MPKRKAGLSPKQEKFLREYLIDQNAYQAALRAGYSPATARAQHTLLRNPVVARKIEELRQAGLRKIELKLERVLEEAAKIAFANMAHYTRVAGEERVIHLAEATEDQLAAVSELTVEDFLDGRGEDARAVRRVRLKLHDKLTALIQLGKHLGGFGSKIVLSGPNDGPIEHEHALALADLDPDERQALRSLIARRLGTSGADEEDPRPAGRRGKPR